MIDLQELDGLFQLNNTVFQYLPNNIAIPLIAHIYGDPPANGLWLYGDGAELVGKLLLSCRVNRANILMDIGDSEPHNYRRNRPLPDRGATLEVFHTTLRGLGWDGAEVQTLKQLPYRPYWIGKPPSLTTVVGTLECPGRSLKWQNRDNIQKHMRHYWDWRATIVDGDCIPDMMGFPGQRHTNEMVMRGFWAKWQINCFNHYLDTQLSKEQQKLILRPQEIDVSILQWVEQQWQQYTVC